MNRLWTALGISEKYLSHNSAQMTWQSNRCLNEKYSKPELSYIITLILSVQCHPFLCVVVPS
jgi:hypothetical protein